MGGELVQLTSLLPFLHGLGSVCHDLHALFPGIAPGRGALLSRLSAQVTTASSRSLLLTYPPASLTIH